MQINEMILVSIDDHLIEPPDMYRTTCRPSGGMSVPEVVRNAEGVDEWVFQGESDLDPVWHGGHRGLAARAVGLQSRRLLRTAPGVLRRPRAGAGHERQRRAGIDELPDHGRVERPHLHRVATTRKSRLVMLRAYNDWAIDEWCGSLPGPVHPARASSRCGTSIWQSRRSTAIGKKGCRSISFLETPHVQGFPSFLSGYWDPMFQALCEENMVLSLHIGAGFDV